MTQQQIEGNKIIAEFMGDYDAYHWGKDPFNEYVKATYHSSWGRLMPVVEKISKEYTINIHSYPESGFDVTIKEGNYRRGYGENYRAIEATWLAIVDFIKWYNQQH